MTTSTTPDACAGVVQVIVVAFTTVTAVAAVPPNVTASEPPLTKPVPVMVTAVPPDPGPWFGERAAVIVGPLAVSVTAGGGEGTGEGRGGGGAEGGGFGGEGGGAGGGGGVWECCPPFGSELV